MGKLKLAIETEISDELFREYITTYRPFVVEVEPSGMHLYRLLRSVFGTEPTDIVETGCLRDADPSAAFSDGWSTLYLARFAHETHSRFTSLEQDGTAIMRCRDLLKSYGLEADVSLLQGESPRDLPLFPAKFYFLDSCDGLDHGLEEFAAALHHKPKMIVMDDWDSKCSKAAMVAKEMGISVQRIDRYTVFDLRDPR